MSRFNGTRLSPRALLAAFACGMAVFLALDALWLLAMGARLYRPAIGHLMRDGFDPVAALAFYLVYLAGVVGFAVVPAKRVSWAALRGAFFGLVAYATYDLTNQATLKDWPWLVTLADLAWGTFVTATASGLASLVHLALTRQTHLHPYPARDKRRDPALEK